MHPSLTYHNREYLLRQCWLIVRPLLSKHWIPSLLGLIDKLGRENVFVSILENGSIDDTKELLDGITKGV